MKTSQILMDALDIIDTPGKWTKHAFARKAPESDIVLGTTTFDMSEAVCFCSLGAVRKASNAKSLNNCHLSVNGNVAESYLTDSAFYLSCISAADSAADINDRAESPFDEEMTEMWLGAIFCALADEKEYGTP
jgi:hypothetical protein